MRVVVPGWGQLYRKETLSGYRCSHRTLASFSGPVQMLCFLSERHARETTAAQHGAGSPARCSDTTLEDLLKHNYWESYKSRTTSIVTSRFQIICRMFCRKYFKTDAFSAKPVYPVLLRFRCRHVVAKALENVVLNMKTKDALIWCIDLLIWIYSDFYLRTNIRRQNRNSSENILCHMQSFIISTRSRGNMSACEIERQITVKVHVLKA